MRLNLSQDGFLRIPIKSISRDIRDTLLSYEDRYFYYHFGINPLSLVRAVWFNLNNKRVIGASTITMQVARMMHRKPRTIGNKIIEIFMALQLEYHYPKEKILEIYLNNTPYGGNIEGFASASFSYFNTPIKSLSLAQIAYLISIPKNPNFNRPKNIKRVNFLKNRVLLRLYNSKSILKERYIRAKDEYLFPYRNLLPNEAPHLSSKFKGGVEVVTTINLSLQQQIQKLLKQRVEVLKELDIYNAMAIVIDNKSMEILAYVGSQDFADKKHAGEVDGIEALISPGSTLKPFVYAKAFEKGLITPLKKLYDRPLFIDGYEPLNYSEEFLGEVTAKEALQLSLNIPAVELDRFLEKESLYSLLKKANIPSLNHPKEYYGSSLVLGGFGITLKNLAQLFASFANGGVYQHSSYLKKDSKEPIIPKLGSGALAPPLDEDKAIVSDKFYKRPIRILSKESSYLISQILVDAPRNLFSSSWEYLANMQKVAFKTGTSANAIDMLAVGYTPNYTVAVWYGNFSGKKGKSLKENGLKENRLTGLQASSPTLFDIFRLLKSNSWFNRPKGIINKKICQDAIKIGRCREYIVDTVIKNVKLSQNCNIMRAEVLATLFDKHYINNMQDLSSHSCYNTWRRYKPLIVSPIDGVKQIQNRLLPEELKKTKLQCYSFETNSTIIWLINNYPPIRAISSKPFYYYLPIGSYKMQCLDQGAKIDKINIEIDEI